MAVPTRVIRQRIKSVKNTEKITKAMEMVAASKMRKAVSAVTGTRPFSQMAWETVSAIGSKIDTSLHPLLQAPVGAEKTLYIIYASDRGLCGGFNTKILKESLLNMKEGKGKIEALAVGQRSIQAMHRAGIPVVASFINITNNPTFKEIQPVAQYAIEEFQKGTYDRILIAYTDYISALAQKPRVFTLLPLSHDSRDHLGVTNQSPEEDIKAPTTEYVFEPSARAVLDAILPRIVETMVWQALLESSASEHSARMMAMRSASDAAGEMIDDLTLSFNQARQAGITQEIAEISSGAAALE